MIRETIKRETERRGWSAYRLAKESGLGVRGVQAFMSGAKDMTSARVDMVLKALGLTLAPKRKGRK